MLAPIQIFLESMVHVLEHPEELSMSMKIKLLKRAIIIT